MPKVAIFTDSASDITPEMAAADGITVVPVEVRFGSELFRPGVNLSVDEFWVRMTAPGSPFPTTAAPAPGEFAAAFQAAFDGGADAIVCIDVSEGLSATYRAAVLGAELLPGREIHVIDSRSVSAGVGMLAQLAARMAAAGSSAAEIVAAVEARKADIDLWVALDTLEYLKRGGRISGARAAIGTMLSVKPIITIENGVVENADRVRSRAKAWERALELAAAAPVERATILRTVDVDVTELARTFAERAGLSPDRIQVQVVGSSVGPHIGPGAIGIVVLKAR